MKKIIGIFVIFGLMWVPAALAEPNVGANNLSETIQYLLAFVKNSGVLFFRNDKEHTAGEAAAHMQRKYEHFKEEIKTSEDFIRLTATKSLITGRLYYVRLKNEKKLPLRSGCCILWMCIDKSRNNVGAAFQPRDCQ